MQPSSSCHAGVQRACRPRLLPGHHHLTLFSLTAPRTCPLTAAQGHGRGEHTAWHAVEWACHAANLRSLALPVTWPWVSLMALSSDLLPANTLYSTCKTAAGCVSTHTVCMVGRKTGSLAPVHQLSPVPQGWRIQRKQSAAAEGLRATVMCSWGQACAHLMGPSCIRGCNREGYSGHGTQTMQR